MGTIWLINTFFIKWNDNLNNLPGKLTIFLWNVLQSLQNQLKDSKSKIDALLSEKVNLQKDLETRWEKLKSFLFNFHLSINWNFEY